MSILVRGTSQVGQFSDFEKRGWDGLDMHEGGIGVHVYMEKVPGMELPGQEKERLGGRGEDISILIVREVFFFFFFWGGGMFSKSLLTFAVEFLSIFIPVAHV